MKSHSQVITSVSFSPDGTRIVTGGWDTFVIISSDSTIIVSGSEDNLAIIWDAKTGN